MNPPPTGKCALVEVCTFCKLEVQSNDSFLPSAFLSVLFPFNFCRPRNGTRDCCRQIGILPLSYSHGPNIFLLLTPQCFPSSCPLLHIHIYIDVFSETPDLHYKKRFVVQLYNVFKTISESLLLFFLNHYTKQIFKNNSGSLDVLIARSGCHGKQCQRSNFWASRIRPLAVLLCDSTIHLEHCWGV